MNSRIKKLISILVMLAVALCLPVPNETAFAGVRAKGFEDEGSRILPYDKIDIQIYPQEEQTRTLEVDKDGNIFFSFLGEIKVEGLSEDELSQKLRALLVDGYLRDPNVTVKMLRENHIVVMGEVQTPQTVPYEGNGVTFIEAIAMAGGFSELASLNRVKIVRRAGKNTQTLHVNAKAIMDASENDFLLRHGDVVIVPATVQMLKENQVVVIGYVSQPQTIPVQDGGITFLQAIAMVGGFAELAAVTRVKIVRRSGGKTKTLRVNAKHMMNGKEDDFMLVNGDTIIVPERYF